ncbi:branched-chain amino acid ABC transporter permease [Saxibacter everestensis]|uniref:Branched-chain amino acid ABC transporter permease n=1 Tax=Saxibacter everestensis TaxID=2909229 RepID=A0ABY8QZ87_9MICO|nr:branched-chain amino acid ABC transporter permease [Brevibacteriaceae bacterium ZFBP1038]
MLRVKQRGSESSVGVRVMAIFAALFVVLLSASGVFGVSTEAGSSRPETRAQASSESVRGTLKDPDSKPVPGVSVRVAQGEAEIGTVKTSDDGTWTIPVPNPGTYTVILDASTLPTGVHLRTSGGENLADVVVRPGQARTVIFPLILSSQAQQPREGVPSAPKSTDAQETLDAGPATSRSFGGRLIQQVVEGLKLGAIIAITAVGLSLVFGTTRLINFAHGELVTIGAIAAYFFSTRPFGLPMVLATLIAIVVGGAIGFSMDRVVWRPMRARSAGLIQMFIISIGISLLLRHLLLALFGSRRQQYDQYTLQQAMHFGPLSIAPRDLIITILSVLVLIGVALMLLRTRIGKATRAVADNKDLAEASGIDVNKVISVVWVMGGGLAALGGVFYGLTEAVYWDMGFNLLLLMFAGVILGGLGNAFGAVVGSFVIGLIAQLSTLWFPAELQNAWALLALIVVLLIRPQGILGRAERVG